MKRNRKSNDSVSRLLYRTPYCDIIMMARFSGSSSMEVLKAALSKARAKYPLLNSRISQDDDGNTKFMFDYKQNFPITEFDNKSDTDWLDLAWDEQKKPFDLQNGPLIKFLLIHTTDTTDLVIICHHCICDGLSLTYLIRDIALFLEEPDVEVQMLPIPPAITKVNLSINISMGVIGFLIKIVAKHLNQAWNKSKVIFTEQDYEQLYREYWFSGQCALAAENLPPYIRHVHHIVPFVEVAFSRGETEFIQILPCEGGIRADIIQRMRVGMPGKEIQRQIVSFNVSQKIDEKSVTLLGEHPAARVAAYLHIGHTSFEQMSHGAI